MNKAIRGAVGIYLIYLGYSLLSGYFKGQSDTQMAPWMIIFFGVLFVGAGLFLLIWIFRDAAAGDKAEAANDTAPEGKPVDPDSVDIVDEVQEKHHIPPSD